MKLSYAYGSTDNNGNVKSQTITVPTVGAVTGTTLNQCYTYDEFNRLKTAEERIGATPCSGTTVWTQKFTYDQQGNRRFDAGTTIPVGFPNPTINSANNNRINAGQGYEYDLAGNVTQDPAHGYTFDAEERQSKVDAGATGQYFYDGKGQRVKSITSSGTTIYVYDAMGRLIAEYTSVNATGSGTSYITADTLGSPRVITAQDKSVKARHDYLPFGEEIPAGFGSRTAQQGYVVDTLRQKFTGKERDVESGLDYFGVRYFSSPLGRFNSADSMFGSTADPQSLNLYSYGLNNPLKYVDPTGHYSQAVDGFDYYGDREAERNHEVVHAESPPTSNNSPSEGQQPGVPPQPQPQRPLEGKRYLLVVGDPGLGEHNVGRNFQRAADTGELTSNLVTEHDEFYNFSHGSGFSFKLGRSVHGDGTDADIVIIRDLNDKTSGYIDARGEGGILFQPWDEKTDFDNSPEAPDVGNEKRLKLIRPQEGLYFIRTRDGKHYAKFRLLVDLAQPFNGSPFLDFEHSQLLWAYQPDGTRNVDIRPSKNLSFPVEKFGLKRESLGR